MRDIFPINEFLFFLIFCLFFSNSAYAENILFSEEIRLEEISKNHVFDARLAKEWHGAVFLKKIIVNQNSNQSWFLVKFPSKPRTHSGYCGSGTEDYIYLTNLKKETTVYSDKFLIRSCLLSIEVNDNAELSESMEGVRVYKNGFLFKQTFPFDDRNCQPIKEFTLESSKNGILRKSLEINFCNH